MKSTEELRFWKAILMDRDDFLERLLALLAETEIRYCVIGGVAVNAYSDPVITLDLDLVIAVADLERAETELAQVCQVKHFPYRINLSSPNSRLRVQIQLDPRYADFIARATPQEVMNVVLPVALPADLLQGKVWAVQDLTRRASKRQKDYADIARLLEEYPQFKSQVPDEVLAQLVK